MARISATGARHRWYGSGADRVAAAARIAAMARTAFVAALLVFGFCLPADAQVTAFVNGRVIDGIGKVIEQGTVVVRDGKIAEVGPAASVRVPDGATRVELKRQDADARPGQRPRPPVVGRVPAHRARALHPRQPRAPAPRLCHLRRDHRVLAGRRPGRCLRTARRTGDGATGPGARLRGRADRHGDHRRRGAGRDRQGDRPQARPAQDPRRRQPRHVQEDARRGWRATLDRAKAAKLTLAAHIFYLADAKALAQAGARLHRSQRPRPAGRRRRSSRR